MTGIEWRGDWKDHGGDWSKGIIQELIDSRKVKHNNPFFAQDGAFWMCVDDF